jgi:hypothetical protein
MELIASKTESTNWKRLYDGAAIAFKVTFQDKPTKQLVLTMVFHQKEIKKL